jgi:hypothetical protein
MLVDALIQVFHGAYIFHYKYGTPSDGSGTHNLVDLVRTSVVGDCEETGISNPSTQERLGGFLLVA